MYVHKKHFLVLILSLTFQNVFKQKVDVESNKIIDPYKQPFDIKPVSPTESEDELTLHTVTTKGSMNSEEMTSVTRSYIITSN